MQVKVVKGSELSRKVTEWWIRVNSLTANQVRAINERVSLLWGSREKKHLSYCPDCNEYIGRNNICHNCLWRR